MDADLSVCVTWAIRTYKLNAWLKEDKLKTKVISISESNLENVLNKNVFKNIKINTQYDNKITIVILFNSLLL